MGLLTRLGRRAGSRGCCSAHAGRSLRTGHSRSASTAKGKGQHTFSGPLLTEDLGLDIAFGDRVLGVHGRVCVGLVIWASTIGNCHLERAGARKVLTVADGHWGTETHTLHWRPCEQQRHLKHGMVSMCRSFFWDSAERGTRPPATCAPRALRILMGAAVQARECTHDRWQRRGGLRDSASDESVRMQCVGWWKHVVRQM